MIGYASPGKRTQEGSQGSGNVQLELRALRRPGGEARLSHFEGTGEACCLRQGRAQGDQVGEACSRRPAVRDKGVPCCPGPHSQGSGSTVICLECEGGGDGTQRLEDSRRFKIVSAEKKGGHYKEELVATRPRRGHL